MFLPQESARRVAQWGCAATLAIHIEGASGTTWGLQRTTMRGGPARIIASEAWLREAQQEEQGGQPEDGSARAEPEPRRGLRYIFQTQANEIFGRGSVPHNENLTEKEAFASQVVGLVLSLYLERPPPRMVQHFASWLGRHILLSTKIVDDPIECGQRSALLGRANNVSCPR